MEDRVPQDSQPRLFCATGPFFMLQLAQAMDAIAKAGYAGIELLPTAEKESQSPEDVVAMAESLGLQIGAVHAPFLLLTRRVFSTNPMEKIRRSVDLAQSVSSPLVVVHPPYQWQASYARWCRNEMKQFGEREGVTIAMENMFPVWIGNRTLTFHRSTGIEDMKVFQDIVLDTSHLAVSGIDIITAYEELADRVTHVHLSNNLGDGRDSHSLLTEGVLPVGAFLDRLGARGYRGTITIELDVRPWANQPARLRSVLRDQREYVLEHLGASAGSG